MVVDGSEYLNGGLAVVMVASDAGGSGLTLVCTGTVGSGLAVSVSFGRAAGVDERDVEMKSAVG